MGTKCTKPSLLVLGKEAGNGFDTICARYDLLTLKPFMRDNGTPMPFSFTKVCGDGYQVYKA